MASEAWPLTSYSANHPMRILILLFLTVTGTALSQTKEKKFLESYAGQTVDQLIALASDYRVDSLVLAF